MLEKIRWREVRSELLFFIGLFAVWTAFGTTAYGMYHIPSESMLPTLVVGDRIAVNKFAYGYSRHSVPFSLAPEAPTETGRIFARTPERGDIVVFKHPKARDIMIKRVIGLPGDEISVNAGRLYINGALAPRSLDETYRYREHQGGVAAVVLFTEGLPGGRTHPILERGDRHRGDFFGPVVVPDNHLFMMGDNRDNSIDSRFLETGVGFVPMDHLIGRAEARVFSINFSADEAGLARHGAPWFSKLD